MLKKLIFVEDDMILGSLIAQALIAEGFEVNYLNTLNGIKAVIAAFKPDLLLLDLEVGNCSSLDELPFIRMQYPSIPVIFASSHTDGEEIARSYNTGVNQYIKKPYDIKELLIHINKLLPETNTIPPCNIPFGKFQLNISNKELSYENKLIKALSLKEFKVLQMLIENKGEVVLRTKLLQEVWENENAGESLNNCINALRNLIKGYKQVSIETVKGTGYYLKD